MSRQAKILVVDDTPEHITVLKDLLVVNGYGVAMASSGADALKQLEQEQPDLVLLDVVMPGMNGPQLAEELTVIRPDIRIQFMTGYSDDIVTRQALQDAGNALLQKPFLPEALLGAVREALTTKVVVHGRNAV